MLCVSVVLLCIKALLCVITCVGCVLRHWKVVDVLLLPAINLQHCYNAGRCWLRLAHSHTLSQRRTHTQSKGVNKERTRGLDVCICVGLRKTIDVRAHSD